jgi:hypothetical protein
MYVDVAVVVWQPYYFAVSRWFTTTAAAAAAAGLPLLADHQSKGAKVHSKGW